MKNERIGYLIKKYTGNDITAAEEAELMQFLLDEKSDLNEIKALMNETWDDDSALMTLDDKAANRIFEQVVSPQKRPRLLTLRPWMGWAAASVLLCVGTLLFYSKFPGRRHNPDQLPVVSAIARSEHKKIILPDGSTVILNNNSTLEYPEKFTGATRTVKLHGEGYFEILHNPATPFIVQSGKLKTTVLGTAFNIKSLNGGKEIIVTVTTGKVSIADEHKVLGILASNEQMVFHTDDKKPDLVKVQAEEIVQWQKNDLFFENITMEQAAAILSRKFNVKITFLNDQGKNCRFTATFLKGESLEEILKVITSFNDAEYKILPGEIMISGKNCNN
ncbi:FecR family protein [Chitinophaga polysaccharea]|uniref:FecR family protein n=1 Tax=Chitinophaga polysaccharea TaxID=1293035 RepID=UPI00115B8383|nr:FecR domain-containing protein [Chitinophaga polysaccharea]